MKKDHPTNNSLYGEFTRRDNPEWRRTYITNLPTVMKNKQMDHARRRFRTSGEEYGHFWRENSALKLTSRTRLGYGTTNPAKILYTDQKMSDEKKSEVARKVYVQTDDDGQRPTEAHAEAQRNRRNRDMTWAEPRRRNNMGSKFNSLPPIENTNKYMTGSRTTRARSKTPTPRRDSEAGIRIAGRIAEKLKLPDINRIDLDLYTPDGEVVSITAVPIYVNTLDRK